MKHKYTTAYQDDDCYRHDDTHTPCYNSLCSHYTLIYNMIKKNCGSTTHVSAAVVTVSLFTLHSYFFVLGA